MKERKQNSTSNKSEIERLYLISEAAQELGLDARRLREAIARGELSYYCIGERNRRVRVSDINDWLKSKRICKKGK